MSILGTRVIRTEDPRFLTTGGVYTDDVRLPGTCHVHFVRSAVAHARIRSVDVSAALEAPGVVAAFTGADLADLPVLSPPMPGMINAQMGQPLLARDVVRYVGEPLAVVVTENRYQGEDAADLVDVDYDMLPPVVDMAEAAAATGDETGVLFPAAGSNVAASFGDAAALAAGLFDGCEVVVSRAIVNQRVAPAPMETRAAVAVWGDDGRLTAWIPNQGAQGTRQALAAMLGIDQATLRIITPDVGGAFGAKFGADPEHAVVCWVARQLGRPCALGREPQREHGRHDPRPGAAPDRHHRRQPGREGSGLPAGDPAGLRGLPEVRRVPAGPDDPDGARALRDPAGRGGGDVGGDQHHAGRRVPRRGPAEATAAVERAMDLFAAETGLDPAEVRRKNLLPAFTEPHTTAFGAVYDSGDYATALDKALIAAGYADLRAEQAKRRADGDVVQLGIGLSSYVEITGPGMEEGGPRENATVEVHPDGSATILTGTSPHGQGHVTVWAMLASDELGIPIDKITVKWGDTDLIPEGGGTGGSRSLQQGGAAVRQATRELLEVARQRAAGELEANAADLVFDTSSSAFAVAGDPDASVPLARLAERERLLVRAVFSAPGPTFPFGAHVAVAEVDTETGQAVLRRVVTVDDAGTVVNPLLAEGQRHGGIAQGAAQALLEEVVYDADGNPLTATFADYPFITATEVPSFELADSQTPTTYNPLGAKGIGEAGTIGSTPAVQNAIIDAVAHLGVRHIDMPASPQRVWQALRSAQPPS